MNQEIFIKCKQCRSVNLIKAPSIESTCGQCGYALDTKDEYTVITCESCYTNNRIYFSGIRDNIIISCRNCKNNLENILYTKLIQKSIDEKSETSKDETSFFTFFINITLIFLFIFLCSYMLSGNVFDFKLLTNTIQSLTYVLVKYKIIVIPITVISLAYLFINNFKTIFSLIVSVLTFLLFEYGIQYFFQNSGHPTYGDKIMWIIEFILILIFFGNVYSWLANKIRFFEFAIPFFLFTIGILGLSKVLLISKQKHKSVTLNERKRPIPDIDYWINQIKSNSRNWNTERRSAPTIQDQIISHFNRYGYNLIRQNIIYRSEGYQSFPSQDQYVRKHGFFSKRLVAALVDIPFDKMSNDCKLNHEKMGAAYQKAYEIKEKDEDYFQKVYNELLGETRQLVLKTQNADPMLSLCYLNTGWCMWESYLISTGSLNVASRYSGSTFQMKPRYNSNALTFATKQHCGQTEDAVILWISTADYEIEQIR